MRAKLQLQLVSLAAWQEVLPRAAALHAKYTLAGGHKRFDVARKDLRKHLCGTANSNGGQTFHDNRSQAGRTARSPL